MEPKGVVLYNRGRREPFQATMYHSVVCKARGECICDYTTTPAQLAPIRHEQSFRILPKAYSVVLPPEVLLIPQVKKALSGPNPQLIRVGVLAEVVHYPAE